ncbi:MAG: hypothetical protein JO023_10090, partial [Chloroflexi bacterium]|nr:hypothetical protein [Chloroflexota bacterium]
MLQGVGDVSRALATRLFEVGVVLQFTIVGTALGGVVAGLSVWFIDARLAEVVAVWTAAWATDQVQFGILEHVTAADFIAPHTTAKLDDLHGRLEPVMDEVHSNGSGVVGVSVVARDGTPVYSDKFGSGNQSA